MPFYRDALVFITHYLAISILSCQDLTFTDWEISEISCGKEVKNLFLFLLHISTIYLIWVLGNRFKHAMTLDDTHDYYTKASV